MTTKAAVLLIVIYRNTKKIAPQPLKNSTVQSWQRTGRQYTVTTQETAPEELYQIDTIPPTSAEASIRKQIAERNNVSESYVARSEKFMRGVEIMEQMVPGMQEKILSGQTKVSKADMQDRKSVV